eukprot:COSAG02_NODE_2743_length_8115_cov_5.631487_4_plen_382_part_00
MTFSAMVHDKLRMRSYERDIWATVCGKRVLEVGTGALAPLTQMCLAAGAAEVVTVERSTWAAEAAAELLAPHRNCRVIAAEATSLTLSDVGGDGCFDVLVHGQSRRRAVDLSSNDQLDAKLLDWADYPDMCAEIYGCVAGAEGVLETCAALRKSGFSWMQVVSRGFEVMVAPCRRPPLQHLAPPLQSLCANPNGESGLEDDLRTHNWSIHNCPDTSRNMLLAQPKVWQRSNLEQGTHCTTETLRFTVPMKTINPDQASGTALSCDGLLFSSRFFFHCAEDTLDTLIQPTHWGTFFVPFNLPDTTGQCDGRLLIEVLTEFEEDSGPSRFELRMRLGQQSLPCVDDGIDKERTKSAGNDIRWSKWVRDEASRCKGLPSHEYFM